MQEHYQPKLVEQEVQQLWESSQCFKVSEDPFKKKFYCLSMFPYPSGQLHMGHVRNYVLGDSIARYQRMQGKNVLQPMGWDAFGLPAENAALMQGVSPAHWTYSNVECMRTQLKRLGLGYDWSRELITCQPDYYRWEQWLFTHLIKKKLVYRKNSPVNWDPVDKTVLANEQVINGRGWRSGALVERREMPQWFLKITAYADELLDGLDQLTHWPDQVKNMQRNWIGRAEGWVIHFPFVYDTSHRLPVFTTRPDTLMGVTYLAIAPQHPVAQKAAKNNPKLQAFLAAYNNKLPTAEIHFSKTEKKGIDTGIQVYHPITNKLLNVWTVNFVLMEYGTGAVMGVPAHDERDFDFAQRYQLALQPVLVDFSSITHDYNQGPYTGMGRLIDSGPFTGLSSKEAINKVGQYLLERHYAYDQTYYRLRDWNISRQRYWGTPIPIIHCTRCGTVPVPEHALPVLLPEQVSLQGVDSPLKHLKEFYETSCPTCGQLAHRDTDTFDTFVESSWYYARFTCPDQTNQLLDARSHYWTPVDHYVGGIEHAILHLLYARFIHKILRDMGLVSGDEPFTRLLTQGMVLKDGAKMSKSKGNTIDPDILIQKYGCDTIRLFILFAAPPDQTVEWFDQGVEGTHRFLKRLWSFVYVNPWLKENTEKHEASQMQTSTCSQAHPNHPDKKERDLRRQIHEILQSASHDYDRQQFNTVVSSSMKLFNLLSTTVKQDNNISNNPPFQNLIREGTHILLKLLAPIVPHITQVLWKYLNFGELIIDEKWPQWDENALKIDEITWPIQIDGKVRSQITCSAEIDTEAVKLLTLQDKQVQKFLQGKKIHKIFVVPGKIVSISTN